LYQNSNKFFYRKKQIQQKNVIFNLFIFVLLYYEFCPW